MQALRWNGRNDRGCDVGSGVYFFHLESGNQKQTGRLAKIR